jgi:hypothetical protein
LYRANNQIDPKIFGSAITIFNRLRKVVASVNVNYRERKLCWSQCLHSKVKHHNRVFATREKQPRLLEFGDHLTNDVNRFGF